MTERQHVEKPEARASITARAGRALRSFVRQRDLRLSLPVVVLLVLIALTAPLIAPHDPAQQDLTRVLEGPSPGYLLGTDGLGRDILSRLIWATRVTVLATLQGLGIAVVLGVPLGLLAGFRPGWWDALISRVSDAMLALPPLILAIAIVGILGPDLSNAMIAVGIVLAPRFLRVARAAARSATHEPYVEALRADGFSGPRILLRHILPNSVGPILVQVSLAIGMIITAEAGLSFLGLGSQPPESSWGGMIRDAFGQIRIDAWPIVPPSVLVVIAVAAFFQLGDALRARVDRSSQGLER